MALFHNPQSDVRERRTPAQRLAAPVTCGWKVLLEAKTSDGSGTNNLNTVFCSTLGGSSALEKFAGTTAHKEQEVYPLY